MHRLDCGDEFFTPRTGALADFAGWVIGNLLASPSAVYRRVEQEHALEAAEQHFVGGIFVPLGNLKIVARVHAVIDDGGTPLGLGIAWLVVGEGADAVAFASLVAAAVQWQHDEVELSGGCGKPAHAVGGRLVLELNRSPFLRPVGRWDKIKYGAGFGGVAGFAGVPLSTGCDLGLAVTVDVAHGDADVVAWGEVLDDDVFFPRRVFIPGDVAGVAQDDIGFFVAVHVGNSGAVADLDVGIDGDVPELGQIGDLAKCGPAEKGEGECCNNFHGSADL